MCKLFMPCVEGDTSPSHTRPLCQGGPLVQLSYRFPLKIFGPDNSLHMSWEAIQVNIIALEPLLETGRIKKLA